MEARAEGREVNRLEFEPKGEAYRAQKRPHVQVICGDATAWLLPNQNATKEALTHRILELNCIRNARQIIHDDELEESATMAIVPSA